MITQSIRNVRKIELGGIQYNKDTGEVSRELYLETSDGQISISLVASALRATDLAIKDYELKVVDSQLTV